jgi:hypothetical protein
LVLAEETIKSKKNNTDINKQTQERYVQALIWNKKYKLAELKISGVTKYANENWLLIYPQL